MILESSKPRNILLLLWRSAKEADSRLPQYIYSCICGSKHNMNQTLTSIIVELTSTFLPYRGLVRYHHRILNHYNCCHPDP